MSFITTWQYLTSSTQEQPRADIFVSRHLAPSLSSRLIESFQLPMEARRNVGQVERNVFGLYLLSDLSVKQALTPLMYVIHMCLVID